MSSESPAHVSQTPQQQVVNSQLSQSQSPSIPVLSQQSNIAPSYASSQAINIVFLAKLDSARTLTTIISTLYHKKGQSVTLTIRPDSIHFTVEEARVFQGAAQIKSDVFQEYNFHDKEQKEYRFSVNLSVLLNCLQIFPQNQNNFAALQLVYQGMGHPLRILLEQNEVTTDCKLATSDPDIADFSVFQLNPQRLQVMILFLIISLLILFFFKTKIVIKSESLKDAFNELDWSSSTVDFHVSKNEEPNFRLATSGTGATCCVDYLKDSEALLEFSCEGTHTFHYKIKYVQPCLKALAVAKRTRIRIDTRGLLSLEYIIGVDETVFNFVEFNILAIEPEGDDMSEEE